MTQKQNKQNVSSELSAGVLPTGLEFAEASGSKALVLCDDSFQSVSVPNAYKELFERLPVHWIHAGEQCKSIEKAQEVWRWLEAKEADRFDTIIVIGGGTVMDLGAFVASTYKRGVKFLLIPTSLLGMVDASIGGKNGINFNGIKNSIGTFHKPANVLLDIKWLETLPKNERLNGWMELSKHALVEDAPFWNHLQNRTPDDQNIDWPQIVQRASDIKQRIVDADFHERGERKKLNFGHTVGHALESLAAKKNVPLSHGFAVGIGMIASLHWSAKSVDNFTSQESLLGAAEYLKRLLKTDANYDTWKWCVEQHPEQLWPFMLKDKKNRASTVLDIRLRAIGTAEWDCPLTLIDFKTFWASAF